MKEHCPDLPSCFSRADILGLYEQVLLTDIDYSDSQNVDQALWKNVFYQVIERFRQLLKDPAYDNTPHVKNMLLILLDEVRIMWGNQSGQNEEVIARGAVWMCVSCIEHLFAGFITLLERKSIQMLIGSLGT